MERLTERLQDLRLERNDMVAEINDPGTHPEDREGLRHEAAILLRKIRRLLRKLQGVE